MLHKRTEKPAFRSALESIMHDIKGARPVGRHGALPGLFSRSTPQRCGPGKRAERSSTCSSASAPIRQR
jgi:hypothetical protein